MRRSVLITGCSSGIGYASAIRLAGAGYHVIAGIRCKEDRNIFNDGSATGIQVLPLDVTSDDSVSRSAQQLSSKLEEQGLYGLVNNAGVGMIGPLEFIRMQEVREVMEVNVLGALRVTQAVLPLLRKGSGRIVNIGSGEAFLATPINGTYSMSKFALEALSESFRMELAPWGVSVTVIEPGHTATRILEKGYRQIEDLLRKMPEHAYDSYEPAIKARFKMSDREGMSADRVARVIERALSDSNPNPRYFVGLDVRGAAILGRFVPARIRDTVFRRFFGFPGHKTRKQHTHNEQCWGLGNHV